MSSKSAGYCCHYISGGEALLLLCEAELGQPMQTLTDGDYGAAEKAKEQGLYSTWGQGMTGPSKWKDATAIHESLAGVKIVSFLSSFPPNAHPLYVLSHNIQCLRTLTFENTNLSRSLTPPLLPAIQAC